MIRTNVGACVCRRSTRWWAQSWRCQRTRARRRRGLIRSSGRWTRTEMVNWALKSSLKEPRVTRASWDYCSVTRSLSDTKLESSSCCSLGLSPLGLYPFVDRYSKLFVYKEHVFVTDLRVPTTSLNAVLSICRVAHSWSYQNVEHATIEKIT